MPAPSSAAAPASPTGPPPADGTGAPRRAASRSPASVHDLVHGRWKADVLLALLELRIPGLLDATPRSSAELAAAADADPDRLRRLLVLAVAIGLVARTGPDSFASTTASDLLRADHPHSMRTEAMHALSAWSRIAWDGLDVAVRTGGSGFRAATGQGVFAYLTDRPDQAADFHAFQAQVTRRNAAALLARYAFPAGATVVDVGGGTGALLRAILAERADLRGVLYDRPEVAAAAPPADRLTAAGGDFFASVPAGGDVYLLSHVLHDWTDPDAVRILSRVAAAMGPESTLLVVENVRDDDANLLVAYLDLLMLTAWGSRERSPDEYVRLFDRAGLAAVGRELLEPRARLTALTACRR
jgi:hypothetical protein